MQLDYCATIMLYYYHAAQYHIILLDYCTTITLYNVIF
jgi:hypothetical protein